MKTWLAVATIALSALSARAELAVPPAHAAAEAAAQDPLARQILSRQITQDNGGVTAAVRVASGQSVTLALIDLSSAPAESLKDAVADPKALAPLKTAPGLQAAKPRKARKSRPARRAVEQLKTVSGEGRESSWGGRR